VEKLDRKALASALRTISRLAFVVAVSLRSALNKVSFFF
jgi:hypothetical protein